MVGSIWRQVWRNGILGSEYSEARTREYALKIGSSQKGLHNNVLKVAVGSSYDYRNGEKNVSIINEISCPK